MVKKIASLLFLVGSAFLPAMSQHQMVIPCPLVANETGMLLQLDADVVSYAMPALADEAAFLQQELQKRGKKAALKKSKKGKRGILLRVDTTLQGQEAYRMEADARQIVLTGGGEAGVFYAIQTPLMEVSIREPTSAPPCCNNWTAMLCAQGLRKMLPVTVGVESCWTNRAIFSEKRR